MSERDMNSKPASVEKLLKILKLEADTGYRDRAVIGGLAQFADRWRDDAQHDRIDTQPIDAVASRLRAYSGLTDAEARGQAIHELIQVLNSPAAATPPSPAATSETDEQAEPDPLAHLEIAPLRPPNNLA